MKKMKKLFEKMSKATAVLGLAAMVFVSNSATVCAYDRDSYERTDEGYYITNRTGDESSVTLYMYANTESRDVKYNPNWYHFTCLDGVFPEGVDEIELVMQYKPENKKVYDTLTNGEVWVWQFPVENGTYFFAHPRLYTDFITLTPDLEENILPSEYAGENIYIYYGTKEAMYPVCVTLENSSTRVYCLYPGNDSPGWIDENLDEFIEWAKANEEYYTSIETGMEAAESKTEGDTTDIVQVSPSEEAEKLTTTPEPVVVNPEPKATEIPLATAAPVEEETNSFPAVPVAITVGIGVAVLAVIIKLKRK